MQIHFLALCASLILALNLGACSPGQNWRDVGLEGSALKAQLPCKPDKTTRSVPLGGHPVDLHMVGCESGSAMVAVMTALLPAGADANAVLLGWQKATLDNARVQPGQATGRQTWHRPGHLPLSASLRLQATGLRANGEPVRMDAVWGAVAEGDRVRLVHAVLYDAKIQPEMATTLFDGIQP
ncbi:hypothetical protein [Limnohabitans sp. G3-2]|uniref:hypothetical protein n=1 Tax=Limnohabitans sp. G3-2 TaxID=1100711 RepID=UPI000C1E6434|nr:hypothetical protein [Limnohabitans sp. G3-2]PIT72238.1 hypothetical protein B9Z31_14180 [Limnohabitans sp. G3-2]